jgi:hypothetical protein
MSRGFLNHIWYKLLDEEGVPIPSAAVYIYSLNGNTLTLYNASGGSASNPVYTDSTGAFEFYVKDDIGVPSGLMVIILGILNILLVGTMELKAV